MQLSCTYQSTMYHNQCNHCNSLLLCDTAILLYVYYLVYFQMYLPRTSVRTTGPTTHYTVYIASMIALTYVFYVIPTKSSTRTQQRTEGKILRFYLLSSRPYHIIHSSHKLEILILHKDSCSAQSGSRPLCHQ